LRKQEALYRKLAKIGKKIKRGKVFFDVFLGEQGRGNGEYLPPTPPLYCLKNKNFEPI
jgi:hypothetical protein